MKYGELITNEYPIVITKTNPIDPTIEEIDDFFNEVEKFIDSTTGPYVFISYSEKAVFISSEARIRIGHHASRLTEKYGARNKGSIIVSNGVIATVMLKAISVVYKPLKENIIVSSMAEAYTKAQELLK
ncbi:MAG TPA: hypothetical protein VL947_03350 [Cytophagales bacterium]|nr:hypothetical protein [Cytophagales bacterium]